MGIHQIKAISSCEERKSNNSNYKKVNERGLIKDKKIYTSLPEKVDPKYVYEVAVHDTLQSSTKMD